jgi:general secretion pathway protein I
MSPARRRGFTLVEVLVALAITATALAAGSRAAVALLDNTQRFTDITAAQWCADNRLVNLKLSRQFPDIGDTDFACPQLGVDFRGTLRVRATPNRDFRRVDAAIAAPDGRSLLTLSTIVMRY